MRTYSHLARAVTLSVLVMAIALEIQATPPAIPKLYDYKLSASTPITAPGTYDLTFSFTPLRNRWETASFNFETDGKLQILSDSAWTSTVDSGVWVSTTVRLGIAPSDTSYLYIRVILDSDRANGIGRFFVSSQTTAEMKTSISTLAKPSQTNNNIDPDTLTGQQLAEEYRFSITIDDDRQRQFAEDMFGPLPDSIRYPGSSRIYILWMTMGEAVQLHKHGMTVDFEPTHPTKAEMRRQMQQMKPTKSVEELKKQSLSPASAGISLAHVEGMNTYGVLPSGQPITFYLWVNNSYGVDIDGLANGFRVYSPDGAQWDTTIADTLPLNWEWRFNELFNRYYLNTLDGIGADTVGFLGIGNDLGGGFPPGFQEIALSITIGPIPAAYDGKTICLDSSWFGTSTPWQWVKSDGYPMYPDWDGPHCFTVSSAIQYSGVGRYRDIRPPTTTFEPIRECVIEWWEDRLFFDRLIQSGFTSSDGFFPFFYETFDNLPDLYFILKSSNYVADVSAIEGGTPFEVRTPVMEDHPIGSFNKSIVADSAESPFFFVADRLLYVYDRWTLDFGGAAPAGLNVDLDELSESSHQSGYDIHIEGSQNASRFWPDYWDAGVIDHEYAHAIEYYVGFFDASPGGEHSWWEDSGELLAASEGFSTFFANIISSDPRTENCGPAFTDTFWTDSENGEFGVGSIVDGSANNLGTGCEAAVAGIFWDIFDSVDDDYSSDSTIYGSKNVYNPDGIGDTLSLGHDEIIEVLHLREVGGSPPDNMGEFRNAWFQFPSFGHHQAMADIWYEHGELVSCCIGQTGDCNGDGTDADPLDLSYLQDNLYSGGPPAPCADETDMDGDGVRPTPIDLAVIVDFLFAGGAPPVQCP